jgi:hypothetical protein
MNGEDYRATGFLVTYLFKLEIRELLSGTSIASNAEWTGNVRVPCIVCALTTIAC